MNINKIIKEETQKFLNESFIMNDDKFRFQQRLNNSVFNNYETFTSEFDTNITQSDIIVTWKVSFWLNQSGIENFIIDVEKVEGMFNIQMLDLHSDELKQETQKNIEEFEWKFVVDNTELIKGGTLYISELQFDFKNKVCMVKF
jgi:hypothetical protein